MVDLEVINSNPKLQTKFYDCYKRLAYDTVKKYIKDDFEVEEVIQQGFIKIFNLFNNLPEIKNLDGFLYTIFKNCSLDQLRKKKYVYEFKDNDFFEVEEEKINKEDMLVDIENELKNLSPMYHLVFKCYHIDNMTHKDISKKLGISEGTSKSNLHKATKKIQNTLKSKIYE